MKSDDNPMARANAAPRCTATSRRTGKRCKGPAVKGWSVCRYHGAGGGHQAGPSHPTWKHGLRSKEFVEARREANRMARDLRSILDASH